MKRKSLEMELHLTCGNCGSRTDYPSFSKDGTKALCDNCKTWQTFNGTMELITVPVLFARPDGRHYHIREDCMFLSAGQFEELGYKQIYVKEMQERKLLPCPECTRERVDVKLNNNYPF